MSESRDFVCPQCGQKTTYVQSLPPRMQKVLGALMSTPSVPWPSPQLCEAAGITAGTLQNTLHHLRDLVPYGRIETLRYHMGHYACYVWHPDDRGGWE